MNRISWNCGLLSLLLVGSVLQGAEIPKEYIKTPSAQTAPAPVAPAPVAPAPSATPVLSADDVFPPSQVASGGMPMPVAATEAPSTEEAPRVEGLTENTEVEFVGATIRFTGGVTVSFRDINLTAENVSLDQESGDIVASGDVRIRQQQQTWQGEQLTYNYKTQDITGANFKVGASPFYAAGESLGSDRTNNVYNAQNALITTDDIKDPVYRIKAKTLVVVPGQYIEATDATAYLAGVPVFFWHHYKRVLGRHPNNWVFLPGYRTLYGPYLLSTYNMQLRTNLSMALHMDYRTKRGFAGGPDLQYNLGKAGGGEFKFYGGHDLDASTNSLALPIDNPRYRFWWDHKIEFDTNLVAKAVVRQQSDEYLIRDFFEYEYRENIQPSTFVEVNKLWPNFSLNLLAQPQVNDFYETVERLPDIKFTAAPQQLGKTPLYYESDSSLGYYRHQFANNAFPEFAAWRGDSFHQITLPRTFFGWLNVTPRVGGRYTHYGESTGAGIPFTEQDRWVFNTGAEVSFKASKLWRDKQSKFWQVDGLRHIIQPSINYAWVPSPDVVPPQLPQFDPLLPSFRLLPFEFPEFNAIDAIDSQNVFRFGLRNKLQTKRHEQLVNIINWSLFLDWNVQPRVGQKDYSDLFSDIDFQPWDQLTVTSQTRYDLDGGVFQQADHTLTYEPNNVWSVSVGHRYLRALPNVGVDSGHNLISGIFYLRLNENWSFRTQHFFEMRDGVLEEQDYTLYRDMRSWTSAFTIRHRNNRFGKDDFTIGVTFSLKAFPRYGVGQDKVTPSLLLGG